MPKSPQKAFLQGLDESIALLEDMDDQLARARLAASLAALCVVAAERYGEQRSAAFAELREMGWSLGDLAHELGMSRARAAQIAVRERYKSGESRGGGGRKRR